MKLLFFGKKSAAQSLENTWMTKVICQTGITEGSREAVLQHLTTAYPQLLPSDKEPTLAPPELGIVQL